MAVDIINHVLQGAPIGRLERLGTLLPPTETLHFRSQRIQTDNYWLPSAIAEIYGETRSKARVDKLKLLRTKLAAMRDGVRLAAGLTEADSGFLRRQVLEVLRDPEYRAASPNTVLQAIKDYIRQVLGQLVSFLRVPAGPASLPDWLLALALLLLALLFGFIAARRFVGATRRARTAKRERQLLAASAPPEQALADLLNYANAAAAANDLRSAVRWLFLASLATLQESGRIRWRPSATNRDYLHQLESKADAWASIFDRLSSAYERCWYGTEPVNREGYNDFERSAKHVIALGAELAS